MKSKVNISYSLLRKFQQYLDEKYCGQRFKTEKFDKIESIPSDAMKLGHYFEYRATGAVLRDGTIPGAETTKKDELTAKYQIAEKQAEAFQGVMKKHGFKADNISVEMKTGHQGRTLKGIADIIDGDRIIDVKMSGLLWNKWEEYGWENLRDKKGALLQPLMYSLLFQKLHGKKPEFYFYVASSTNDYDKRFFQVEISDAALEIFENETLRTYCELLELHNEIGFDYRPVSSHCESCPINDKCKRNAVINPGVEIIKI